MNEKWTVIYIDGKHTHCYKDSLHELVDYNTVATVIGHLTKEQVSIIHENIVAEMRAEL